MKTTAFLALLVFLLIPFAGHAKTVTFLREYTYDGGDADSKLSCRAISLLHVKQLLLEALGIYLETETDVVKLQLSSDQIKNISAGFVKTEIVSEQWNGRTYWLRARIEADPEEVVRSIDQLRQDLAFEKKLEEMQQANVEALERILELKAELQALQENLLQMNQDYQAGLRITDAVKWFETGWQLAQEDNYQEAQAAFDKAITLNPSYRYYFARGRMYQKQSLFEQAIKDFDIAISLSADFPQSYFFRGTARINVGQTQEGLADIEKAAALGYSTAAQWLEKNKRIPKLKHRG